VLLQLDKQPGRRTCAGLAVQVRRHLDGGHTVRRGTQLLGAYDAEGRPRPAKARTPTHQDALGSTPAPRVDTKINPAISSYGPSAGPGRARVPAPPVASGSLRPALPPHQGHPWHRRHSESGQITCQNGADRSLVINTTSPSGNSAASRRSRQCGLLQSGR
jgi:hypothetical protein